MNKEQMMGLKKGDQVVYDGPHSLHSFYRIAHNHLLTRDESWMDCEESVVFTYTSTGGKPESHWFDAEDIKFKE